MYYPVAVPGALFSVGDPHASQGDSELCGTAIECSLTGTFQLILHKKATLAGTSLAESQLSAARDPGRVACCTASASPTISQELGAKAQSEIYAKSSVDLALRDAFRKMRAFLMTTKGLTEDEAISLMSIARRLRRHPGGRRQLGRPRHRQEEPVRRRSRLNAALPGHPRDEGGASRILHPRAHRPHPDTAPCPQGTARADAQWVRAPESPV